MADAYKSLGGGLLVHGALLLVGSISVLQSPPSILNLEIGLGW